MKKLFIIGNWKSYKDSLETKKWFQQISSRSAGWKDFQNKEIILCVPFTVLPLAKSLIAQYDLSITLGVQDISPFDEGKYTGEINGKQIKEFADYVLIGHSERRKYFGETDEMVNQKIAQAFHYELTPIVCVSEVSQVQSLRILTDKTKVIIAYEPLFAIGSGHADTPENAEKTSAEIQNKMNNMHIIYGGSVTAQNVHSFTSMHSISGVLPGGASLDPEEFAHIVINA